MGTWGYGDTAIGPYRDPDMGGYGDTAIGPYRDPDMGAMGTRL